MWSHVGCGAQSLDGPSSPTSWCAHPCWSPPAAPSLCDQQDTTRGDTLSSRSNHRRHSSFCLSWVLPLGSLALGEACLVNEPGRRPSSPHPIDETLLFTAASRECQTVSKFLTLRNWQPRHACHSEH